LSRRPDFINKNLSRIIQDSRSIPNSRSFELVAAMPSSVLMFLMVVIRCARTSTHTGTDQSAFPSADQCASASADCGPDADAFRRFLFARLGISPLNGSGISTQHKTNSQKATDQNRRNQFDDICPLHTPFLLN
jgi:hypothetical protein